MTPEQMQKIVDDAPEWAKWWDGLFYASDYMQGAVRISYLRDQLAKHEPMDLRSVDIPHGTIVLEK